MTLSTDQCMKAVINRVVMSVCFELLFLAVANDCK